VSVTSVASAEEGLLVSLNERGAVDLPFIGSLYGKERKDIIAELGDLIFPDPELRTWQTADAYLSGNVRHKLAFAENARPLYARNVNALRAVQPEDVLPGDIDAGLGAPWITGYGVLAVFRRALPKSAESSANEQRPPPTARPGRRC
jgi:N12 class adenine-specific DNA methylase